jgi:hypothetical protein
MKVQGLEEPGRFLPFGSRRRVAWQKFTTLQKMLLSPSSKNTAITAELTSPYNFMACKGTNLLLPSYTRYIVGRG